MRIRAAAGFPTFAVAGTRTREFFIEHAMSGMMNLQSAVGVVSGLWDPPNGASDVSTAFNYRCQ